MNKGIIIVGIVIIFFTFSVDAQEERLADKNFIGWVSYTGNYKFNSRLSWHTEAQWRRVEGLKNRQQLLIRTGINYTLNKQVNIIGGYAFAETYPYGDYPLAFTFPEHRLYQQVIIKNPVGKINLSHRFTLEQRFVGSVSIINDIKETDYKYMNRIRYRIRTEIPLNKEELSINKWSIILQDELFVGWGKQLGTNIFDQNRMGVLGGYTISPSIKIEAGYINQFLQQGRRVNHQPVIQYNHGFLISGIFNVAPN